jgi:hypothetical protein
MLEWGLRLVAIFPSLASPFLHLDGLFVALFLTCLCSLQRDCFCSFPQARIFAVVTAIHSAFTGEFNAIDYIDVGGATSSDPSGRR